MEPDASEVKRYLWGATAIEHPQGTLVALADYAALQARVKQVVEEGRAICRLNVQQAVEIGGLQARVRELDEVVKHYATCDAHRQQEWQADLDRLHQVEQERDQLRARVERLESALRHIAEARWSPRTTASYDEDARYAYPERESYVRQYAQRAWEGNEEHGTRRDE